MLLNSGLENLQYFICEVLFSNRYFLKAFYCEKKRTGQEEGIIIVSAPQISNQKKQFFPAGTVEVYANKELEDAVVKVNVLI